MSEPVTPPVIPAITTVTWKPSGPCIIEGPVVIRNNDGDILIPPPTKHPGQVKLCGCGRSANKPFCEDRKSVV